MEKQNHKAIQIMQIRITWPYLTNRRHAAMIYGQLNGDLLFALYHLICNLYNGTNVPIQIMFTNKLHFKQCKKY